MARITVEDCLRKENNRFALVLLASKRAKQLLAGATPLTDTKGNKQIVSALREIEDSHVRFMTPEEEVVAVEQERLQAEREAEMRPVEVRTNGHHERMMDSELNESLSAQAATSAADLLFGKISDDDAEDDEIIEEKDDKNAKKNEDSEEA